MSRTPDRRGSSAGRRLRHLSPRQALAAMLAAAGLGGLAFLLAEPLREVFLTPVIFVLWAIYLLLRSVPQAVWWALTVIFLLLLARRSLRGLRLFNRPETAFRTRQPLTRSKEWILMAVQAERGGFPRWELSRQVAALALDILAQRQRMELPEARRAAAAGYFDLPEPLRKALLEGIAHQTYEEFIHSGGKPAATPDEFAAYLEKELEIRAAPWKGESP